MVGPPSINTPSFNKKPSSSSSNIKLLCSYGGKILPRYPDGKLRYHGGETRLLAVNRSISFHELLLKLAEMCGVKINLLRCQLPTEDLDALVSITSDEDLSNIIEEYNNRVSPSSSTKIRAFIYVPKKLSRATSFSTTTTAAASSSSSRSNDSTSPPISMHASSSTNNLISSKSVISLGNQRLSCCRMSAARPGMIPMYYGRAAESGGKLPPCLWKPDPEADVYCP